MTFTWSRIVRFEDAQSVVHYGQPVNDKVDVGKEIQKGNPVQVYEIVTNSVLDPDARLTSNILTIHKLLCPLNKSEAGPGIRCIGLQYTDHAKEMGIELPSVPSVFMKPRSALHGPNMPIKLPSSAGEEIDYETEFVIVVGKDCKDVSEAEALDYVLGYTVGNDVTSRFHQKTTSQWCYCKGFDGFAPIGPCIVSPKVLPDPHVVDLSTTINGGAPLQEGKGAWAIFKFSQIISYLSQGSTLEAGTVIFTGTPAGIGASRKPPVWLKNGDTVCCTISHGLGTLVNTIE